MLITYIIPLEAGPLAEWRRMLGPDRKNFGLLLKYQKKKGTFYLYESVLRDVTLLGASP
jgi:hypothetical protein